MLYSYQFPPLETKFVEFLLDTEDWRYNLIFVLFHN